VYISANKIHIHILFSLTFEYHQ